MIRLSLTMFAILAATVLAAEQPIPAKIEYNRDVRPILAESCFRCHGFDKAKREGNRRLDTRDGALAENDGVRAIVPGDVKASEVHLRIHSRDRDEVMPPAKEHHQLTARQRAILDRWIEQGAAYQVHWAYIPPVKPSAPEVGNPIDAFVFARHAQLGLRSVGAANPATLCRRLYLDLLGLPPKLQEVEAFEKDTSPNACEKLVERLLASPHYGERMALLWLDLVRYADSIGYHSDVPRNVWPYRDYVIRVFNDNVRFDRFTIEQIAGDLLPHATRQQKVASAFNRLNMTTEEGGAQAKEYEAKTVTDRVKAIGTAWLGQTYMCAECHDHKYDPFTARDFYSLGAFFSDIKESPIGRREDGMPVPTPEQEAKLADFDARLAPVQKQLDSSTPELESAQRGWEAAVLSETSVQADWQPLHPSETKVGKRATLTVEKDGTVRSAGGTGDAGSTYTLTVKTALQGIAGFRLEALASAELPAKGPGRAANGNFVLSEFTAAVAGAGGKAQRLKFASASATFEQPGFPAAAAIDGKTGDRDNGWAVSGGTGADQAIYFALAESLDVASEQKVTFTLHHDYGEQHTIGKFRIAATTSPDAARTPKKILAREILALLEIAPEQRDKKQRDQLARHYRSIAPALLPARTQLAALLKARADLEGVVGHCLVSEHTDQPRTVRILPRGDWMKEDGEVVQPAIPHYLPQPKIEGRALTRLDLGEWLVSRDNPLTARVFMNRLWKQFFGIGLSKTLEDMGTQGEIPPNQALLDWLACEFMESGWDVKHMVGLMVTSAVYRQSSRAPRELVERDPDNREFARQSRFRLDAEYVRDSALAISGLLVPKIGGPSVKQYQPAGYWENLNFPVREWEPDKNDNQWRRGLYTWWQRSYLHPSLVAFDAPSREECTAARMRSNIPQQALALLNDPTYVEAARAFAARILREGGSTKEERLAWAWRQATARAPRPDEMETLRALLDKHTGIYAHDAQAAAELVKVGISPSAPDADASELAAWTSVARAILNLHETITRL